ncbi:NCAIR mutase-like protein [Thermoplasmatales archaeon SCGC AB-539-C06]|nr:NCAIR mutase-like protein [Thermoplasmatales archaeon SCGC AB-539-C06]
MGSKVEKAYDVGVAGIHRLFDIKDKIFDSNVIIVIAGMEGALASIVGGLTSKPVIAVPTSIGYGASFKGIAPLLTMMNTCSEGVVVVNIDNGFGAGYFASLINR